MNQDTLRNSGMLKEGSDNVDIFGQYWFTKKKYLYWICQILGWGAFCFLFIINNLDGAADLSILVADTITTTVALCLLSHFFRYVIHRLDWLKLYFLQLLPRVIIASVGLALLALPFQIGSSWIYADSGISLFEYYGLVFSNMTVIRIFRACLEGGLFYLFWQIAYFLYHHVNKYNRNLRIEASIHEFQLNKLRSQLNPHFIFNALNSVKALVDESPERAKESIYQLSSILRNSLVMDKKKVIAFKEELDIVKNYLALEGTRFEERLQVEYEIDPTSLSYKVPPMMLQTIVENGIKHGISKLKNGGKVHLKTYQKDDNLHIEIRNSGRYNPQPNTTTGGYGLKSTKQRLALLYDNKAKFTIENHGEDEVLTTLIMPTWKDTEQDPMSNSEKRAAAVF